MPVIKANILRHDNENRFVDSAIGFMQTSSDTIGKCAKALLDGGVKVAEVCGPLVQTATIATAVFASKAIIDTGVSAWKAIKFVTIANKEQEDLSRKRDRALNILEATGQTMGTAAEDISRDIHEVGHEISGSCKLVSTAVAVSVIGIASICFRHSVCLTHPDSIFCAGPSLTTKLMMAGGLLGLGRLYYRGPVAQDPKSESDPDSYEVMERIDTTLEKISGMQNRVRLIQKPY